ncbi:hypothetical protein LCGC14_1085540 [marine sediment metagenome]|uniref:Uncharacterized protein n=1 Tax=marine sediment metagenome TaxID=412755 RepID=A0A0F9QJV2_9ZZZZ
MYDGWDLNEKLSLKAIRGQVVVNYDYSRMVPPPYDTKDGIATYLAGGLEGLKWLIKDRSRAGYVNGERMEEWIILGRWRADACGNFDKILKTNYKCKQAPKDLHEDIPDVVTMDELWKLLGDKPLISSGGGSGVPPIHIVCPECERGWTIDNCHDTIVKSEWINLPLAEFIGSRLDDVQIAFNPKTDGEYLFDCESPIRNDKWVDLTPDPGYKTFKINENGSIRNSSEVRSFKDKVKGQHLYADYIIKEDDTGCFNLWKFYHKNCYERLRHKQAEEHFCEIVEQSGWISPVWMVDNEYCSDSYCCWPWAKFKTEHGMIKIGWRKRVINIDWSNTGKDYEHLFKDEGVTLDDKCVHAWSKDKAIEYLTKIREYES